MAIVKESSERYRVLSGKHAKRICSVCREKPDPPGFVSVIFDHRDTESVLIQEGALSKLSVPGWEYDIQQSPYGLKEYLKEHQGNGSNMLREKTFFIQPRTASINDQLASGELVVRLPRQGYSSSVLIRLSETGWVELAPRLPIALIGHEKFKFPFELKEGDRLVTGCSIAKDSECLAINWIRLFFADVSEHIAALTVPSCIPLALA